MADHINTSNLRISLLADSSWKSDIVNVSYEDIEVPTQDLFDPDGNDLSNETNREKDQRWTDLDIDIESQ